ncbi:MAG: 3'-5' exonuclease, partial [Thermoanaerobaculia bacterium]|nr:3'-5' exonuclease [Thermoanaerobaculia bacterium]
LSAFHLHHSPLAAPLSLTTLGDEARAKASRAARRGWWRLGPVELLSQWVERLRGEVGPRSRMRLDQALELAARFELGRQRRPGALAAYLEAGSAEAPAGPGIRVMTIHRAKGLEFDVVAMPELDGRLLARAEPLYLRRRSPLLPVEAVHRGVPRGVRELSEELAAAWHDHRQSRLRDDLSTLYVAMTRARHALLLWPRAAESRRGEDALSFASILRQALGSALGRGGASGESGREEPIYRKGEMEKLDPRLGARAVSPRRSEQAKVAVGSARQGPPVTAPPLPVVELVDLLGRGPTTGAELLLGGGAADAEPVVRSAAGAATAAASWIGSEGDGVRELVHVAFAVGVGGRTVVGSLDRVWVAADSPGVSPRRAAVLYTEPGSAAGVEAPPAGAAEVLRAAASRRFAIPVADIAIVARDARGAWRAFPAVAP